MRSASLSLAALAATLVSAAPRSHHGTNGEEAPVLGHPFGLEASAPDLGNGKTAMQIQASGGRLYIGGKQDEPTCGGVKKAYDYATFVLYSDTDMFLWSNFDPIQQVYSDQGDDGLTAYGTAPQALPDKRSLYGFKIGDDRTLTFNGKMPMACPAYLQKYGPGAAPYSIWFSDKKKPGNLTGCFSVELRAYKTDGRDRCTYSHN